MGCPEGEEKASKNKKCPKCGGILFLMRDYDPVAKKYEETYRYAHMFTLGSLLKTGARCTFIEHVSSVL